MCTGYEYELKLKLLWLNIAVSPINYFIEGCVYQIVNVYSFYSITVDYYFCDYRLYLIYTYLFIRTNSLKYIHFLLLEFQAVIITLLEWSENSLWLSDAKLIN